MHAVVNVVYTQMHTKNAIMLYGDIAIAAMVKYFKYIYEGSIPENLVVTPTNRDELRDA